jgi:Flp pilus assembly protein TadD/ADP-heptose:LPS heptosyltransferase
MPEADSVESNLEAAMERHRAGQLDEAERLYVEVLRVAPRHWRAAHNLGVLYLAKQQPRRGASFLENAMAWAPDAETVWPTFTRALINLGEFEKAERLITDHRADPKARVLELRLRQVWGAAYAQAKRSELAEEQFRRALELAPDDPDALADLGYALTLKGDFKAAEATLRQALELAPDDVGARLNLGSVFLSIGQFEAAEAEYRSALALDPTNAAATQNLRVLLGKMGRADEAAALAETSDLPQRRARAAAIRGEALAARGEYAASIAAFDEAIALSPENPNPVLDRAFPRLVTGDFAGGWQDYEARWRVRSFFDDAALITTAPVHTLFDARLTANQLIGKRVLLVAEQGVGDQVMFTSIIPDLARAAAKVTLVCEPRLVRLFTHSLPGVETVGAADAEIALSDFDAVVALGSLGRIYRSRMEDFPGAPYLRPGAQALDHWTARLGPKPQALRIGVSWRGGSAKTFSKRRSLSLDQLAPILDLPGCEIVSLQYGEVAEEVAQVNAGRAHPIRLFPRAETDDFEDLAALIETLDVVVSVQNTNVHLSGALGKACLALIPYRPEWRYGAQGRRMAWYDSVQLFRQPQPNDWDTPLAQVVEALRRIRQVPAA